MGRVGSGVAEEQIATEPQHQQQCARQRIEVNALSGYQVDPGEQVTIAQVDVRVDGEAARDPDFEELLQEIPLETGAGLHHGIYEDFKLELQSLGRAHGYFEGELTRSEVAVDVDVREAVVSLHYDSGVRYRFGAVTFDDFPLEQKVLDQLMTFQEGKLGPQKTWQMS